ncbi:hypothetical protein HOD61_00345 [archaeon]|jgi:hypothetical protein|nr:hypothetical protein [archaeon]
MKLQKLFTILILGLLLNTTFSLAEINTLELSEISRPNIDLISKIKVISDASLEPIHLQGHEVELEIYILNQG